MWSPTKVVTSTSSIPSPAIFSLPFIPIIFHQLFINMTLVIIELIVSLLAMQYLLYVVIHFNYVNFKIKIKIISKSFK